MEFTAEQIKKVSKLAKIRLTEEEVAIFSGQFGSIMETIGKLQKMDTTNVSPVYNVSQAALLMREDVVTDGNYVEDIMANVPKSAFNHFVVPKVVE